MIPYIHITIPSYGLLAVIGLLAAMYWQYYQAILKGEDFLTFRQFLLLAGAAVFAKVKRRKVSEILNYVTPGFVLFHAFGRIGCLLAGCCYGFPLTSDWQILGLVFHYFPLQAVEAVFEFTMFGVLIRYIPEKRRCMIYLFAYGVYRFAAEFFRGDTARGIWLGISTSQWIRLLIIISLIIYWIRCKAIMKKTTNNSTIH